MSLFILFANWKRDECLINNFQKGNEIAINYYQKDEVTKLR